jgi:hypothetical protein
MDLPLLLHKIARWALPFAVVPAEVRERAETGRLTLDDCLLIADQLGMLGHALAPPLEVEEAVRLGQETVQLIRFTQEEGHLGDLLQTLHAGSEEQVWQAYLQLSRSMAGRRHSLH